MSQALGLQIAGQTLTRPNRSDLKLMAALNSADDDIRVGLTAVRVSTRFDDSKRVRSVLS
jgi:hypothetical protein